MDAEERRKAEFWDRLLLLWNDPHSPPAGDDDFDLDGLWDLVQEYHRRPRLDGKWCSACDKFTGHPKDRCPNRPMVEKIEKL